MTTTQQRLLLKQFNAEIAGAQRDLERMLSKLETMTKPNVIDLAVAQAAAKKLVELNSDLRFWIGIFQGQEQTCQE